MTKTVALIMAGGTGERFGGKTPKQFIDVNGKSLLQYSIDTFLNHAGIDDVIVVLPADGTYKLKTKTVSGGNTRQESVYNGLQAAAKLKPDAVLIHDAARPFISRDLIDRVLDGLKKHPAVIPALAIHDTLKRASDDTVTETIERNNTYRIQTPQGFHFAAILAAHETGLGKNCSDDALLMEMAGHKVHIIKGEHGAEKITTPEDLEHMQKLLQQSRTKTGQGYDVHQFTTGDHVMLAGIKIPHTQGALGHSDADVALHALTDALLGTMGLGDIGDFFPPSDPQWKNAASKIFVAKAVELLEERGGRINNIDITIICEAPKIAPYRQKMQENIASLLKIPAEDVNIKATTAEGLGFIGRKEGLAAFAIATVNFPL